MTCFVVICCLSMNFEKKTLDTNCTASRGASTDCGAKAKDPNAQNRIREEAAYSYPQCRQCERKTVHQLDTVPRFNHKCSGDS